MQQKVDKEIIEYYTRIDFSSWENLFQHYCEQIDKQNKTHEVIALYCGYIQLMEILFINIFAITSNNLWENLFLSSKKIRQKIASNLNLKGGTTDFIDFLFEQYIFGIKKKSLINDLDQKKIDYRRIINEFVSDYSQDYEVLNAFKHGYRLSSKGPLNLSIRNDATGATHSLTHLNSTIEYFTKEKDLIIANSLSFNWERIHQKSTYIFNILENVQKVLLNKGEKIEFVTLSVIDPNQFSKHFGSVRLKNTHRKLSSIDTK